MHLEQGSCLELPFKFKATIANYYGGSFFRLWYHTIVSILSYLNRERHKYTYFIQPNWPFCNEVRNDKTKDINITKITTADTIERKKMSVNICIKTYKPNICGPSNYLSQYNQTKLLTTVYLVP